MSGRVITMALSAQGGAGPARFVKTRLYVIPCLFGHRSDIHYNFCHGVIALALHAPPYHPTTHNKLPCAVLGPTLQTFDQSDRICSCMILYEPFAQDYRRTHKESYMSILLPPSPSYQQASSRPTCTWVHVDQTKRATED